MATHSSGGHLGRLVPIGVFGAVGAAALWVLLGDEVESAELAWRLAAGLGLALAIAGATALAQQSRERHRLTASVDELAAGLGSPGAQRAAPASGGSATDPAAALQRLGDHARLRLERLAGEREHLLTVLGSMSEGVLVADAGGRSMLVNAPWRELFGVTGEAEGRTVLELTRQTALERMISETLESGQGRQIELDVTRGRRRTVILASSPLPDGAGVVVLARDLTPLLRVGEIRRDFVANVSHELKTPLSAIRGFAETLREGALDDRETAGRFLDRILKQCQRLEALLSDLLTLSRLEEPAARSHWGEIDVGAVLDEAIELTAEGAVERGVELSVDRQPVPPIQGDAEAIVRLCINLLENAIKYNRPGGRVEVRLAAEDDRIVLEIADTGIGIAPESVDRLFERFYRVDKGRSRDEGGTGLGLAIVKHAAQLHGGSVEVESELGTGSRFRVTLPLSGSATPDPSVAGL